MTPINISVYLCRFSLPASSEHCFLVVESTLPAAEQHYSVQPSEESRRTYVLSLRHAVMSYYTYMQERINQIRACNSLRACGAGEILGLSLKITETFLWFPVHVTDR